MTPNSYSYMQDLAVSAAFFVPTSGGDGIRLVGVTVLPAQKLYGKILRGTNSIISKRNTLLFYASIASRNEGHRFTVLVREQNENFL